MAILLVANWIADKPVHNDLDTWPAFLFMAAETTHLNWDDEVALIPQEVASVEGNNSSLVRLSNISKNSVHHSCAKGKAKTEPCDFLPVNGYTTALSVQISLLLSSSSLLILNLFLHSVYLSFNIPLLHPSMLLLTPSPSPLSLNNALKRSPQWLHQAKASPPNTSPHLQLPSAWDWWGRCKQPVSLSLIKRFFTATMLASIAIVCRQEIMLPIISNQ